METVFEAYAVRADNLGGNFWVLIGILLVYEFFVLVKVSGVFSEPPSPSETSSFPPKFIARYRRWGVAGSLLLMMCTAGMGVAVAEIWGGVRSKLDRSEYPSVTGTLISVHATKQRVSRKGVAYIDENDIFRLATGGKFQIACAREIRANTVSHEYDCLPASIGQMLVVEAKHLPGPNGSVPVLRVRRVVP